MALPFRTKQHARGRDKLAAQWPNCANKTHNYSTTRPRTREAHHETKRPSQGSHMNGRLLEAHMFFQMWHSLVNGFLSWKYLTKTSRFLFFTCFSQYFRSFLELFEGTKYLAASQAYAARCPSKWSKPQAHRHVHSQWRHRQNLVEETNHTWKGSGIANALSFLGYMGHSPRSIMSYVYTVYGCIWYNRCWCIMMYPHVNSNIASLAIHCAQCVFEDKDRNSGPERQSFCWISPRILLRLSWSASDPFILTCTNR